MPTSRVRLIMISLCRQAPVTIGVVVGLLVVREHAAAGELVWAPHEGLWRLSVVFLLLGAAYGLGRGIADRFEASAFTSWWDPAGKPDGALEWDELLLLIEPKEDPTENGGALRPGFVSRSLVALAIGMTLVGSSAWILAEWLADPRLPRLLLQSGSTRVPLDGIVNASGNLTAFLALIAAAASIRFAGLQLRSKVRADNRQEWLANARTLLGQVVALARRRADARRGWGGERRSRSIDVDLDPLRLRFELMLNPRERDHRLLMHLLRRLAFLGEVDRADKADGGAFITVLRRHCAERDGPPRSLTSDAGAYERSWKDIVECDDPARLTTYVMRLGHVVLKREWERVKAAR